MSGDVGISERLVVLGDGVSGRAIPVIAADDAVVRWVSGVDLPGIHGLARGASYVTSWWVLQPAAWLLILALIVFRRWRLLVIELAATQIAVWVHGNCEREVLAAYELGDDPPAERRIVLDTIG